MHNPVFWISLKGAWSVGHWVWSLELSQICCDFSAKVTKIKMSCFIHQTQVAILCCGKVGLCCDVRSPDAAVLAGAAPSPLHATSCLENIQTFENTLKLTTNSILLCPSCASASSSLRSRKVCLRILNSKHHFWQNMRISPIEKPYPSITCSALSIARGRRKEVFHRRDPA